MTRQPHPSPRSPEKSRDALALGVLRLAVLLLVIGISIYIYTIRAEAARWRNYGYAGIFLVSILANATLLLPAPGIAMVFAMGSVFNPFLVSLAAGAGAAVGEMSGYAAGFSGQGVLERIHVYDRLVPWMLRYGALTTFVLAAVPNPIFDLAGMAAGAMRMPLARFFFWCLLGKIVKMLLFAYLGAYVLGWLPDGLK